MMTKRFRSRKLRCISMDSEDSHQFPAMEFLSRLESLKILQYGQVISSFNFNLPSNLTRLTLSKFRLSWAKIAKIGKLPNLEVLKLLCRAFESVQWDMSNGDFPKLKFLKLDTLNIERWNFSCDCLPPLERLLLRSCKNLEEFPSSLGEILVLRNVELHWCSRAAVKSIFAIQEEVLEYTGDEGFKVLSTLQIGIPGHLQSLRSNRYSEENIYLARRNSVSLETPA